MAIGLLLVSTLCFAQENEREQFLFYCQKDLKIVNLWPFENNYFIANIRYELNEKQQAQNLFLLFNESHLIVDSLYLKSGFLNSLDVIGKSQFTLSSSLYTDLYDVSDGKFNRLNRQKIPGALEKLISGDFNNMELGYFQGILIGYKSKAKDRTRLKKKKDVPRYFYTSKQEEQVWFNSGADEVIFNQWPNFFDKSLFDLGRVESLKDKVFVNIPVIGKCFVLNTKQMTIDEIRYPTTGADSWLFFIDKVRGSSYLVSYSGNNNFSIYFLNPDSKELTWIKDVENFYDLIWDDKILIKKSENNEVCYYLEPLF